MNVAQIPDWMVVDAVRYALGRATYQVAVTCDWLRTNWQDLPQSTRDQIIRDVEGEFFTAEAVGRTIGMGCDHREWESVRALWRATELQGEAA